MKTRLILSSILFSSVVAVSAAQSAIVATMKVQGRKQGVFGVGGAGRPGSEGNIRCVAITQEIVSPRDVATGQASGRRQWKPLKVTVEMGPWSPQFLQATSTNEVLSDVELSVYGPGSGTRPAYTIKLTDATVSQASYMNPWSNDKPFPVLELSFTFRKITTTWTAGGTTFTDDWQNGFR